MMHLIINPTPTKGQTWLIPSKIHGANWIFTPIKSTKNTSLKAFINQILQSTNTYMHTKHDIDIDNVHTDNSLKKWHNSVIIWSVSVSHLFDTRTHLIRGVQVFHRIYLPQSYYKLRSTDITCVRVRFIDYKNLRSNNNHAKTSNTRVLWEKETKQDKKHKPNSAQSSIK
jgi:hypothetical protein